MSKEFKKRHNILSPNRANLSSISKNNWILTFYYITKMKMIAKRMKIFFRPELLNK